MHKNMIYFSTANQVIKESIERLKSINQDQMFKERDKAIDYYLYNNTVQYINNYFPKRLKREMPLYTTNITKRIINRISLVYKDAPNRQVGSDVYFELIGNKDYKMKTIERIHNLLGTMLIQHIWLDGKMQYRPVINYSPVFDKSDSLNPIAIIQLATKTVSDVRQTQEDEYIFWSAEEHYRFDSTGKRIHINKDDVNPWGVLPFTTVQPNTMIDEYWNDEGGDLITANQQIDMSVTMLNHHIRSAGGQFVIEGRANDKLIQLGLNKVINVEDGVMKNLPTNTNITSIQEAIKFQMQLIAQNKHITFDFGLSGSKSGVALKLENIELLEAREDDVEKWKQIEKEVYTKEKIIIGVETGQMLPDDITVDYKEQNFPDPEREMEEWEWKFKHGLADKADYLMSTDPDQFPSREEAIKHLTERKQSANQIKVDGDVKENVFRLRSNAS